MVVEWRCPICGNEIDHLSASGRIGWQCASCQRTVCEFCVAKLASVRKRRVVCKLCAKAFKEPIKEEV
jgi:protein-arginine kinase activator protein McsA